MTWKQRCHSGPMFLRALGRAKSSKSAWLLLVALDLFVHHCYLLRTRINSIIWTKASKKISFITVLPYDQDSSLDQTKLNSTRPRKEMVSCANLKSGWRQGKVEPWRLIGSEAWVFVINNLLNQMLTETISLSVQEGKRCQQQQSKFLPTKALTPVNELVTQVPPCTTFCQP